MKVGDFNGDGKADIAVLPVAWGAWATFTIHYGTGNGFQAAVLARLSDQTYMSFWVGGNYDQANIDLGRVMLGSVSAGVLRKARCPVLVVPRGAAQ